MSNKGFADQKLKEALIASEEMYLKQIEYEMFECDFRYEFSERFEKRMNRLIKTHKKPYYSFINTVGKRVVVSIMAVLAATFSVKALRDPVVKFLIEVYEKFTSIVFHADDFESNDLVKVFPESIEEIRVIKNVPDGYFIEDTVNVGVFLRITYKASGKTEIYYDQRVITDTKITANTEGIISEQLEISGYDAIFYNNNGLSVLIWTDGEYGYKITGELEKDTLISMTELEKRE